MEDPIQYFVDQKERYDILSKEIDQLSDFEKEIGKTKCVEIAGIVPEMLKFVKGVETFGLEVYSSYEDIKDEITIEMLQLPTLEMRCQGFFNESNTKKEVDFSFFPTCQSGIACQSLDLYEVDENNEICQCPLY